MKLPTLDDVELKGKTVIVRIDINSPVNDRESIIDDTRIKIHSEVLQEMSDRGAKVVAISHQGRAGEPDFISLRAHADILAKYVRAPVKFVEDITGEKAQEAIKKLKPGEILLLENLRFHPDEAVEKEAEQHAKSSLVRVLSSLADIYVLDGFSVAHRSHASVVGFSKVLPSFAGRVLEREVKVIEDLIERAKDAPITFVVGGAKADDVLKLFRYMLKNELIDRILTGGLIGNILLSARGLDLGEASMKIIRKKKLDKLIPDARDVLDSYPDKIELPIDLAIDSEGRRVEIQVEELPVEFPIFDIGTRTIERYKGYLMSTKTILMKGPLGKIEDPKFEVGTLKILQAIADSSAFSIISGSHTIIALKKSGLFDRMSYVTTAGAAFVNMLMGMKLPGIEALKAKS